MSAKTIIGKSGARWTARQAERARAILAKMGDDRKKNIQALSEKYGCELWEVVADLSLPRFKILMREKGTGYWRTSTVKGITYEIAPDGTRYAGTAAEVIAAGLTPRGRNILSRKISQLRHGWLNGQTPTREGYALRVMEARRKAIRNDLSEAEVFSTMPDGHTGLTTGDSIALSAAARAAGISEADFIGAAVRAAIAAAGQIDYTRHERAALAAIREREERKTAAA